MKYKLLIVDDEAPNIRLLERLFRDEYHCLTAASGAEAVELLDQHDFAVIITDQRMPQMTGIELLKKSADRRPHMVRILLTGYTDLEALVEAVNCGLVYMYISKPWNNDELRLRISHAIEHYEQNKLRHQLIAANERLTARIGEMKMGFVRVVSAILKMNDEHTFSQGTRVGKYCAMIGEKVGMTAEEIEDLNNAALLHQLGTLSFDNRPGFGTAEISDVLGIEYSTDRAAKALSYLPEFREIADIIRYQSENFDGSGFPMGLAGERIPLASRIVRVASEYDALTSPRDKYVTLSHEGALHKLRQGAGKKFDAGLVDTLTQVLSETLGDVDELDTLPVRPEIVSVSVN
jgi:response regulator RpfG family c-di-GMP phosphodiesterase